MTTRERHTEIRRGRRTPAQRAGLTALECAGCITALIGGAWLGALYLGIDVRHLAHVALSESQLLDKVPQDWRPPAPSENLVTRDQLVKTLRKELGSLRREIVALRTSNDAGGHFERLANSEDELKARTLSYWHRLCEIALSEGVLQRDAESAFDEDNAANVFAIKARISRFAAKAVDAVPTNQVDASVIQFAQQLHGWFDQGGELYDRAVQIWDTPTGRQVSSQLNKDWRAADLHHRNEARLLKERAAAMRGALSRQFGEEFPEFAKPESVPQAAPADVPPTGE